MNFKAHCGCKYIIKRGIAYYTLCKIHKKESYHPLSVGGVPITYKNIKADVKRQLMEVAG